MAENKGHLFGTGVEVTAMLLGKHNSVAVAKWCNGTADIYGDVAVSTPDGVAFASPGMYILRSPGGTFRVATEAELRRSYDPVKEIP